MNIEFDVIGVLSCDEVAYTIFFIASILISILRSS